MSAPTFLRLFPAKTGASALTRRIKTMALEHGLPVASVTTAETFDGLADHLEAHIGSGHMDGLEWFTVERARFSTEPRNLQATARTFI